MAVFLRLSSNRHRINEPPIGGGRLLLLLTFLLPILLLLILILIILLILLHCPLLMLPLSGKVKTVFVWGWGRNLYSNVGWGKQ